MKHRNRQAAEKKIKPLSIHMGRRLMEGLFLLTVACALFLLISLLTYHPTDPSWSNTGANQVDNWGGRAGAWVSDILLFLMGRLAYILPLLMTLAAWLGLQEANVEKKPREWMLKLLGWFLWILSGCGLASLAIQNPSVLPAGSGGMLGDVLSRVLSLFFNQAGSTLLLFTFFLCGMTLVTGLSWIALVDRLGAWLYEYMARLINQLNARMRARWAAASDSVIPPSKMREPLLKSPPVVTAPIRREPKLVVSQDNVFNLENKVFAREPALFSSGNSSGKVTKTAGVADNKIRLASHGLPPLSLLNAPATPVDTPFSNVSFEFLSHLVEERLADFGVSAKVVAVHPGPVITRFELELAPGIKVSKITSLVKDIARSLSTTSVRIVEVIQGKSVVGLEIPNENRESVSLRDILESQAYMESRSPVSLVLGKDISGSPVIVDLIKMPHLLVAGTTGSGKSVSLNAMLLSMLFKATPEELRLILIDPKMLELSIYENIPHLLTPVITDMKEATNALRWCVAEMDRRYRFMAALGVRNLAGYNQKITEAIQRGEPLLMPGALVTDPESAKMPLQTLPLIVVTIDELADMMMVVGKKVEDLIARIAQKARAAGIHLILATQRPSVDVITGLIKANIPTRIAFQVSSRIDSRTILDQQGAEQLLGHGDMLYLPPGAGVPVRVHGAYVADDEVHRVAAAWRTYGSPQYLNEVTDETGEAGGEAGGESGGEQDPLYDQGVRIVTESRRASISLVQRRLRIGYNRAARMMEEMESAGIVSGMDGSGAREVLAAGPPEV